MTPKLDRTYSVSEKNHLDNLCPYLTLNRSRRFVQSSKHQEIPFPRNDGKTSHRISTGFCFWTFVAICCTYFFNVSTASSISGESFDALSESLSPSTFAQSESKISASLYTSSTGGATAEAVTSDGYTSVFYGLHNESSHSGNASSGYVPYEMRPETYIVPVIFALIFIVGVIGNGTVIYIIYRHKTMRTVANIYILSLAAGDLTLILISVPFVSTIYTFESWPYGLAVCKISEFARDISTGVTVFTLTSLAVQRYTATHHPIRYLSNKGRVTLVRSSALIWSLAIVVAAPGAWHSYLLIQPIDSTRNITVCYPFPTHLDPWYPKTIVMIKFLAYYLVPLFIIAIFYSLMARSLLRSTEHPIGINNESQHKVLKNRKKISKIILGLVLIFAICFFPQQVFMLWFHFDPKASEKYNDFWHVWRIIGFVFSFMYSCLNPLLLYAISGVFRAYFKRYISDCFQGERDISSAQDSIRTRNSSIVLSTRNQRANSLPRNNPNKHIINNNHNPDMFDEEYEDNQDTSFAVDTDNGSIDHRRQSCPMTDIEAPNDTHLGRHHRMPLKHHHTPLSLQQH